jgi:hypothetical protein
MTNDAVLKPDRRRPLAPLSARAAPLPPANPRNVDRGRILAIGSLNAVAKRWKLALARHRRLALASAGWRQGLGQDRARSDLAWDVKMCARREAFSELAANLFERVAIFPGSSMFRCVRLRQPASRAAGSDRTLPAVRCLPSRGCSLPGGHL